MILPILPIPNDTAVSGLTGKAQSQRQAGWQAGIVLGCYCESGCRLLRCARRLRLLCSCAGVLFGGADKKSAGDLFSRWAACTAFATRLVRPERSHNPISKFPPTFAGSSQNTLPRHFGGEAVTFDILLLIYHLLIYHLLIYHLLIY